MPEHVRIIVSVIGGVVQDVFVSDPQAQVVLIDWDIGETEMEHPALVQAKDAS